MEQTRPSAPGLKWRPRKNSPEVPVWVARPAAVKAGYTPKTVKLAHLMDDPRLLQAACERLQAEMLMWLSGRHHGTQSFDGTFAAAIRLYQTDPESPYHTLKPSSRHPYDIYAAKLTAHIGKRRIDACDGRDVKRWFAVWAGRDESEQYQKLAAGRMTFAVLKAVMQFGKTCRLDPCARFLDILREVTFPSPKPREHAPTAEQIIAARKAAHAGGHPSRAFAYALQFETTLRQRDVIGEWVSLSDPRKSALLDYGEKWIGPTWANIDDELILRLMPSKTEGTSEARVIIDLKDCPMVLEELEHIPPEARKGPLVIFEKTGLPYRYNTFRDRWKKDFVAAGIPKEVWNRDFRPGGNTEGQKANTALADRAKLTGHADERTTADVYDRDRLEASRRVLKARVAYRYGQGTEQRERAGNVGRNQQPEQGRKTQRTLTSR